MSPLDSGASHEIPGYLRSLRHMWCKGAVGERQVLLVLGPVPGPVARPGAQEVGAPGLERDRKCGTKPKARKGQMETITLTANDFKAEDGWKRVYCGELDLTKVVEAHIEIEGRLGWVRFKGSLPSRGRIAAEAGSGISAGWGISAGSGISAKKLLKIGAGFRIFAGISHRLKARYAVETIQCAELDGEIGHGTLELIPAEPESNDDDHAQVVEAEAPTLESPAERVARVEELGKNA